MKKVQKIQQRKIKSQPRPPVKKALSFKSKIKRVKVERKVIDTTPGVGVWIPSKAKSGVFGGQ